LQISQ